jgi:hypothetical protein
MKAKTTKKATTKASKKPAKKATAKTAKSPATKAKAKASNTSQKKYIAKIGATYNKALFEAIKGGKVTEAEIKTARAKAKKAVQAVKR